LEGLEISILNLSEVFNGNKDFRCDSDFFKRQYKDFEFLIKKYNYKHLKNICNITRGLTPNYSEFGTKVIRSGDLNDKWRDNSTLQVSSESNLFIIQENDILISSIGFGSIGKVDLFHNQTEKFAAVSEITILRNSNINSFYLANFLKSKFGQAFIEKGTTGATGQLHLNKGNILNICVPILSITIQSKIEDFCKNAYLKVELSKLTYCKTETLLLKTLGLTHFKAANESVNIKSFQSSFASTGRLDAEYYQPKYDNLLTLLRKDNLMIGDVASLRNEGFKKPEGGDFQYMEIGGLRGDGTVISETVACEAAPSRASQRVRKGDIITSTVRPIRRLTALVSAKQHGHVCSSGFAVLQPKQIAAEALLVYLRLPVICELMDLHTSASLYPAISEKDLLGLPIPNIPATVQANIATLVQQSFTLKAQSERLLEAAKRAVEIAIEQDEAAGMAYLAREGALA
jgi:restriction endonuclease S subunit